MTRKAKNAAKVKALWNGDTSQHKTKSEADLALCGHIAFYTGHDHDRIDRLFRQSGLLREKWEERPDYRAGTITKALEGKTEFYKPSANGLPNGSAKRPPQEIIRDYFAQRYSPVFRRGQSIVTAEGETISRTVACATPTSEIIDRLHHSVGVPRHSGDEAGVNVNQLPKFFNTWAPVAFGDLHACLPDEDASDATPDSPAGEEFRRLVSDAMLSMLTLGREDNKRESDRMTFNDNRVVRHSVIHWGQMFARPGRWRSLKSFHLFFRTSSPTPGEILLHVAIRHELMGQIGADRRLREISPDTFARRCKKYGIGETSREIRPGGKRCVILHREFIDGLIYAAPTDETEGTLPGMTDEADPVQHERPQGLPD